MAMPIAGHPSCLPTSGFRDSDYDGVAADSLGQTDGFLGAFGDNTRGNPEVRISKRFGGADDSGNDD